MRPTIAILANYPSDHSTFTGGVATATAALLEGLRGYQEEFDFHIVATDTRIGRDVHEQRDGFWFHFLSIPNAPWLRPRLTMRMFRTHQQLARLQPQLVHGQASVVDWVAVLLGNCKRVHTVHGILRHEARLRTGWEFWAANSLIPLETLVFQRCDAFICISDYAARVVGPNRLCFRIPNAVGSAFFRMPRVRPTGSPHLVFTGVLAPIKRPADLLMAHHALRASFPNLRTTFCGPVEDHAYARDLQAVIAEQHIGGVELVGTLRRDQVANLLAGATALVLPSAQENTPMVIAEAMAAGVPVVASRVGGIGEMIQHGQTGLLFSPGDVPGLTSALHLLLSDPGLQDRLGERARQRAREVYASDRVGGATAAVYRELLSGRGSARMAASMHL
ncbi:MAG: glycosyltransferase family 4 protein [Chloroflexota bacterium]